MSAIGESPAKELRNRIGRVGVWLGPIGLLPAADERAAIARIEELGYGTAWFGEAPSNREAFSHAGLLLAASERLVVATGIANIWARDAIAASNGANTLNEAYGERFLLGLGVSHAPAVQLRGHEYARPLSAMRSYLEAIDQHRYGAPPPPHLPPIVLAALRPRMLELARERTAGAHPYFVPPSHTAAARETLGPGPLLAPEQAVVLETDPARARRSAREHMEVYLRLPNYVNNLRTSRLRRRGLRRRRQRPAGRRDRRLGRRGGDRRAGPRAPSTPAPTTSRSRPTPSTAPPRSPSSSASHLRSWSHRRCRRGQASGPSARRGSRRRARAALDSVPSTSRASARTATAETASRARAFAWLGCTPLR